MIEGRRCLLRYGVFWGIWMAMLLKPMKPTLISFVTLTISSTLWLGAALAQTGAGSIEGAVKDATGAVIPAAGISAIRVETSQEYTASANHAGLYLFPSLQPGQYRMTVRAPGMQTWEGTVQLRTGQAAVVDMLLRVAGAATEITVAGDVSPLVSTVSSTLGATVERERIEQLPLNGRSPMSMVQLTTPGLEGTSNRLRAYGLRGGSMEFVQDGAAMSNRSWADAQTRPPGLDTIEEFKVETNNASAKSNRPALAIITTKSGSNTVHGALFETARNNGIGVARRRQDYYEKAPPLVRNEYGASIGSPLYLPGLYNGRNRTFLFLAYEGYTRRQYATQSTSLPTAAMRQGDFSGMMDGSGRPYTIYDPWSTDSKTWQRVPFPNNRIPIARRSPVATHIYAISPLPSLPDVNPLVSDNWFGAQPNNQDQHTGTLRFDHRVSDRDRFFVRWSQGSSDALVNNGYTGSPMTLDGNVNVRTTRIRDQSGAISWTRNIRPTFFSETLVSFGREDRGDIAGDLSTDWDSKLGLPNPFKKNGFPEIGSTGFNMEFRENGNTFQDITGIWTADQNFTKVAGRHELQFGGRFRFETLDNFPPQQYVKGVHYFNSMATSLYDTASGSSYTAMPRTGHDGANLFLGILSLSSYARTRDWYRYTDREYAGYLQDTWKATPRLTLNLGLRLERFPVLDEENNLITGFDLGSKSIVLGRSLEDLYKLNATSPVEIAAYASRGARFATPDQAGLPRQLMHTDAVNFNPRVGFAYKVTSGAHPLVLRGGYSRFSFPIHLRAAVARSRSNPPLFARYRYAPNEATSSPDGNRNYLLRSVPQYVAGVNTSNLISMDNPDPGGRGSIAASFYDPDQPVSRADQWNLTLEREVVRNTVVRIALVGTHGSRLDQYEEINEEMPNYIWFTKTGLPLPSGDDASVARREWTKEGYGTVERLVKTGWSNFAGYQVEVERRFSRGVGFQFFYVRSHASRAGGNAWSDDFVQDPRMFLDGAVPADRTARIRLLNYHRDTDISRHRLRWNWIVDLPFGRGKKLFGNAGGILNRVIGGWQLAGFGSGTSQYWSLPDTNWGYVGNVEIYGTKYPIEDCRSGRCIPGYLYWNGYIPANRINSYDAKGKPNGVMGVPDNYKPSNLPIWPMPADGGNPNDPNYRYIGTNTVFVRLKNGTLQQTSLDTGLHPWRNQVLLGPMLWNVDASLFKAIPINERVKARLNADFFNVMNMPGMGAPGTGGILSLQNSANAARVLQLTLRVIW
jgi:hypothetical protein